MRSTCSAAEFLTNALAPRQSAVALADSPKRYPDWGFRSDANSLASLGFAGITGAAADLSHLSRYMPAGPCGMMTAGFRGADAAAQLKERVSVAPRALISIVLACRRCGDPAAGIVTLPPGRGGDPRPKAPHEMSVMGLSDATQPSPDR